MGGPPDCRLADVNQAAIALFSAIVALAVAGIGFLLRLGFSDNSPLEWAKYVGLSWFLLHFSLVARKLLRIDAARRLLRETKNSVITIANEVGYSNPSHFAQLFRKETGLAPTDYRRER